MIKDNKMFI